MDNDAFRKIMATPRPHDSKPPEKFDKKSIRKLVDADLQRSKAGSKKYKREKPAKEKKVDKNQMNPLEQSKRLAKASDASTNYDSQSNSVSTSTTSGRKARRHLA